MPTPRQPTKNILFLVPSAQTSGQNITAEKEVGSDEVDIHAAVEEAATRSESDDEAAKRAVVPHPTQIMNQLILC